MSLLERIQKEKKSETVDHGSQQRYRKPALHKDDPYESLKLRIHERIIEK